MIDNIDQNNFKILNPVEKYSHYSHKQYKQNENKNKNNNINDLSLNIGKKSYSLNIIEDKNNNDISEKVKQYIKKENLNKKNNYSLENKNKEKENILNDEEKFFNIYYGFFK